MENSSGADLSSRWVASSRKTTLEKKIATVKEANISNFKNNLTSFNSMEDYFQKEILRLTNDKGKAEELMKQ
ncbi:MAG: hypothetical protein WBH44_00795 [Proteocatella sp.]